MALPRTAVVGPGGVGGLVGALLARAGAPVVYVARPETATALAANGLTVHSVQYGDFRVPATAVTTLTEPVDLCVLAVKETSLAAALADLPVDRVGLVLPLLNGIDHMSELRGRVPAERLLAGAIRVESTRVAPGVIEHTSPFCLIDLAGEAVPRAAIDAVASGLEAAGLSVHVRDSEAAVLWEKLAFLAPFALLTTHAGGPAGLIRTDRRADLEAVVREVAGVAAAEGASIDPDAIMGMFDFVPAEMKSSMQRDAEAGRPIELDAIGGAVLRGADRHAIDVPLTAKIVDDLRRR
jgi:2-dehydropantoate 2-reductase